jgi:glycosyltransferase involved in cell wall biosynthesis
MKENSGSRSILTDDIMGRTVVIIPSYNEERKIAGIVGGIRRDFPGMDVVVIDDGSSDRTMEMAAESGATVLSHSHNMGYGVALQTGYKFALRDDRYSYLVQLDGDGQHDYRDIGKLVQPLVLGKADLVIGSRFLGDGAGYRIGFVRRFGITFFRILLYLLTRKKIKDVTSGMQALSRSVVKTYVSDDFPYYYPDANILLLQLKDGIRVIEIPSAMSENKERKSMHEGLGRQLFYTISMILSIFVIILRKGGWKHAC